MWRAYEVHQCGKITYPLILQALLHVSRRCLIRSTPFNITTPDLLAVQCICMLQCLITRTEPWKACCPKQQLASTVWRLSSATSKFTIYRRSSHLQHPEGIKNAHTLMQSVYDLSDMLMLSTGRHWCPNERSTHLNRENKEKTKSRLGSETVMWQQLPVHDHASRDGSEDTLSTDW